LKTQDFPSEFDERYRVRREMRVAPHLMEEMHALAVEQIRVLRGVPGRPEGLRHFEEVLAADSRQNEISESGKPVIGIHCNFVPEELIHAAGAVPVRLCSLVPSGALLAEEVLPRDICPVVKSSLANFIGGCPPATECDAVIVPASCDGKRKLAAVLNEYVDVWTVDLPVRRDYSYDMPRWVSETKLLRARIEQLTGRRIRFDDLRESIRIYHRRVEAFRELTKLRQRFPFALSGSDMMLVTNSSFTDSVERWTEAVISLTYELEGLPKKNPPALSGSLPVVLTGAPILWPNWKVLQILETSGMVVVADTLCSGTQRLFDPVQVDEWTDEGMIRALALRYFSATLCPCFADCADLIDRVIELAEDYRARGVVSHNLRLCQLVDMETVRLRAELRKRGIPFLEIHTDVSMEDREQIKTRVEAFVEMTAR